MKKSILALVMIIVCTTNQSCAFPEHKDQRHDERGEKSPSVPAVLQVLHDVQLPHLLSVQHDFRCVSCLPERGATATTKKVDTQSEQMASPIVDAVKKLQQEKEIDFGGLLFALLGWLLTVHITYAVRRFNLIKTLQIDIVHRIHDGWIGYNKLDSWFKKLPKDCPKPTNKNTLDIPYLKPFAEDHVLYKSVQSEMVECLWGKEVLVVRETYRWLDELEKRMRRIQTQYERLTDTITNMFRDTSTNKLQRASHGSDCNIGLNFLWNHARKEIDEDIQKYRVCLEYLLKIRKSPPYPPDLTPICDNKDDYLARENVQKLKLSKLVNNRFISPENAIGCLKYRHFHAPL